MTQDHRDLDGKVALVTGGASGIGAAVVRRLAGCGAQVFSADLKASQNAGSAKVPVQGRIRSLRLDVTREEDWEAATYAMSGAAGGLDIMVHAAGISAASPLTETALEDWRRVLETNLDGTFLAIKHGLRAMRAAGGSIVVLGSASGIRPSPGAAAYSTSKAAVGMLVRTAAKECRDERVSVRINAVSPGGVKTPMWSEMPFFQDLVREHGSESAAYAILEAGGGGPFAEPDDVAEAVLFLVSDAASHISGVELPVDGGYVL